MKDTIDLNLIPTEVLAHTLAARCTAFAMAISYPTNSEERPVSMMFGRDYYKSLGLVHGLLKQIERVGYEMEVGLGEDDVEGDEYE